MLSNPETGIDTKYSVSARQFRDKPAQIETDYSLPQKVTRKNFTAFLIYIFRKGAGSPAGNRTISDWLEINQGFDYSKTFNNYLDAGGHTVLTDEERKLMQNALDSVKMHTTTNAQIHGGDIDLDDLIVDASTRKGRRLIDREELVGMPLDTFLERFREASKELRAVMIQERNSNSA